MSGFTQDRRPYVVTARAATQDVTKPDTVQLLDLNATIEFKDAGKFELTEWPPAGAEQVRLEGTYEELAADGLVYGPAFRGLVDVWGERRPGHLNLPSLI